MSEAKPKSSPAKTAAKKGAGVRRVSNRISKVAPPAEVVAEGVVLPVTPDSEEETIGAAAVSRNKRRRRKPKVNESTEALVSPPMEEEVQVHGSPPVGEIEVAEVVDPPVVRPEQVAEVPVARPPYQPVRQQGQPPRRRIDPEMLAKKAWKIFLSEVSEEGVALIGDNDARELSRRCFRLAELFLEEETRRR